MSSDDPRHGTNAGYVAGCRNDCCRVAHAAYRRSVWRRRYVRRTDALYIDITGTQRRIRALQAIGWRFADIDAEAGQRRGWAHNLVTQRRAQRVHFDTAKRIEVIFDRWCMTPGPSQRCRVLAAKNGWAPPLAWEEGEIDDPDARPVGVVRDPNHVDHAVVERILAGDNRVHANAAERVEVCRRWVAAGRPLKALERLTGWRPDRYYKIEEGAA